MTSRPSRTILGAAHQQITLSWWEKRLEWECAAGDLEAAQRRLAVLEGLDVLIVTESMIELAETKNY